jgi:hypothetical protein
MAGVRHGMCELTHCMAGERHGHGMDTVWARHVMCESAFKRLIKVSKAFVGLCGLYHELNMEEVLNRLDGLYHEVI